VVTDLDGNPRFYHGGRVDLGCYELQNNCKPFLVLAEDAVICQGDSVDIPIYISGEPPYNLIYTFNNQEDTIKNIQTNPYILRISPQETTCYVFAHIEDAYYDSTILDSMWVMVIEPPQITAVLTNDTLCSGQYTNAVIFTNTTDSCQWEAFGDTIKNIPVGMQKGNFGSYLVGNKDSVPHTTTVRVEPFVTVNEHVCYGNLDSFSITVFPAIQLEAGVNDSLFCEGDSILFVLFNPENLQDIYWQGSGDVLDTGSTLYLHANTGHTGIYVVWASSQYYCVLPDTVKITVLSAVISNLEDTLFMCDWENVTIYSNTTHASHYQWSTGDTSSTIVVSLPGTYALEASNARCFAMDTITVLQIKIADFEIQTTGDLCADGKEELTAKIENVSYQWNTGDTTQTVSIKIEGLYSVSVTAGPCQANREIELICPCKLFLPNVFTPNYAGYTPIATFELESFSLIIYNRWGAEVYKTDQLIPWDGKINGKEASAGVYYCVVAYSCKDNPQKKRIAQSSVTLVR
jgi:hypothetical protein